MKKWLSLSVLAASVAAVGLTASPALAAPVIQPGVSITMGGSYCTLNWIYDGTGNQAGKVYGGTAAHCVDNVGQTVSLSTGSLGDPVLEIGTVAYIDDNLDYAFIEIAEANLSYVDPALKGHPQIPTGVSTTDTAQVGDVIQFSGHGVGFHVSPITQEQRKGVLHFNDGTDWSGLGPASPGDSGGPLGDITDGNKALGLVTVLCVGVPCAGVGGVSLQGMFVDAAAAGFSVQLRTV